VSRRARLALFAVAGPGFAIVLVIGLAGLPSFGDWHGVYGLLVNKTEPALRHATDIVTALNFDIRAWDTVGEEFIMFGAAAGVALLLRHLRDEEDAEPAGPDDDHRFPDASAGLRVSSLALTALLAALGGYVVLHGQLTPGGGFQGGVILAAAPLAILLGGRYVAMRRAGSRGVLEGLEALDAAGALAYALIGLGGLIFASTYMENFLPFGNPGKLLSSGTMPLSSIAIGVEVAGAFLLIWTEFLDQALVVERE
jgi:multicomponent Na+:H+ antiporter subunit B